MEFTVRTGLMRPRVSTSNEESAEMSILNDCLRVEQSNVIECRALLDELLPGEVALIDEAATLFELVQRLYKTIPADAGENRELEKISVQMSISPSELIRKIKSGDPTASALEAKVLWNRMYARRIRVLVFALLCRYFIWGATDFLRFRLTSALGYMRLEAESIGLLYLFLEDEQLALDWKEIDSDAKGKKFFSKTRAPLSRKIELFGLTTCYEMGSGAAQHVRLLSAARSMSFPDDGLDIRFSLHEMDREDLFTFYNAYRHFTHAQVLVLKALLGPFPEVDTSALAVEVDRLALMVRDIEEAIKLKYPQRYQDMQSRME